jgi:hypothetical protein
MWFAGSNFVDGYNKCPEAEISRRCRLLHAPFRVAGGLYAFAQVRSANSAMRPERVLLPGLMAIGYLRGMSG